jgi:hypothetical protein
MFYCTECRRQHGWPETLSVKSDGACEICGRDALCHDTPGELLTDAESYAAAEYELRVAGAGPVLDLSRADAPSHQIEAAIRFYEATRPWPDL